MMNYYDQEVNKSFTACEAEGEVAPGPHDRHELHVLLVQAADGALVGHWRRIGRPRTAAAPFDWSRGRGATVSSTLPVVSAMRPLVSGAPKDTRPTRVRPDIEPETDRSYGVEPLDRSAHRNVGQGRRSHRDRPCQALPRVTCATAAAAGRRACEFRC
jgi:hypothetical protein